MQPEQQRILGYFIEEAREHLQTIEHGLLNLQAAIEDSELLNEVFRAAHSVKGGAAMLGIHSMQKIAHRLEDYFKVLKEHPIQADQKLESLFFRGFDALNALTEELQTTLALSEETSEKALQETEPVFAELQAHLASLVGGADLSSLFETVPKTEATQPPAAAEDLRRVFETQVMEQLQLMLQLFQGGESQANRRHLDQICQELAALGDTYKLPLWFELLAQSSLAITAADNQFDVLAPIILPALKQARDTVLAGRGHQIAVPQALLALVPAENLFLETSHSGDEAGLDWLTLFGEEAAATSTGQQPAAEDDFWESLAAESEKPPASASPVFGESSSTPALASAQSAQTFVELAALLRDHELAPTEPVVEPSLVPTTVSEFGFEDLEKLLEETQSSPSGAVSAPVPSRAPRRGGSLAQTMKVPTKQLDNLSNLVGELVVNRNTLEDGQERLRQFLDNLSFQVQQLGDLGQQMQDLYERSLLEMSLLNAQQRSSRSNGSDERSEGGGIHATGAQFDALEMDTFTDFHSISQEMIERIVRVREAASDIEFIVDSSEQVTRMFRQVTTQVQEGLTKSRMVPFSQVAERLPRAVRDISLKCGKQAQLELEGRETLIDKGILERIYDPLTHLVNNAIYHGIEPPNVRQALGKPPEGLIRIRAFYQGNQTVIAISDDGAGIDPERIKAKALEKKLITPEEAANLSRQELYALIFQPGFTTQEQVSDLAGRGVGMDVVRSSIQEVRGVINTDSTLDKGTTFTIRLPLTLSITKALCCVDQHCRIAFPIDGVEDVLDLPKEQVDFDEDGRATVIWKDQPILCKPLAELLSYNRVLKRSSVYGSNAKDDRIAIIILRSGDDFAAIRVDQVIGEQEIVIKQLVGPVPKPVGIAGITVLGDGRVMPIADVLELIDLSLERLELGSSLWKNTIDTSEMPQHSDPTVLIVDDSITVRELLSMTFHKVGYRVEQARDGQEAWEKLRSGLPCDLVFCDVEMPRMDGLELLSRMQQDADLQDLPVAMLTSRGAARHKQMAIELGAKGYFTKPYLEEVLLEAAQRMLNGDVLVK
ncbi:response regulator [Synechococcales cyanobacterium C]|uniref:histidine kinase n=1 Tax=Petrachloros mirabilis ULC683 TaxID=2781853 RepID=A0A8K2A2B6_9CYAN|nr:hybrid sensor histidine kinase/response regulator [Petrachloros mirabilis]NCJ08242.1 response regulator [Petrachloros mirabilis ULC683]